MNNTDLGARHREELWQKVATEMGIPWRSAESMHWQLGEQKMRARANAPAFQLHPSATGTLMSSPSQVPVIPASAPHGFKPANAPQSIPPQLHQVPTPMPQSPDSTTLGRTLDQQSKETTCTGDAVDRQARAKGNRANIHSAAQTV